MSKTKPSNLCRRDVLKGTMVASVSAMAGSLSARPAQASKPAGRDSTLIERENQKPGALDWQLTRVRLDKSTGCRSPRIEGYCSRQSVLAGETIDVMVSADPPAKFTIEIFRTGYYGGHGARAMTTLGPLQGKAQPTPPIGEKRLRECRWTPSATLKVPADWPSGVYLGRLTTLPEAADQPYWQSYVIFIVRDTRRADILFQCSDNTWQAYNKWPDEYSLYTDPRGAHARDVSVSFDRPYGRQAQYTGIVNDPLSVGSGEFLSFEQPLAYFLEQHGYDVTYCCNSDCLGASQITRCKTFISVGHDEYWDLPQYHAVKAAIEAGVNVLWLSGNSVFAVSAFSPSADGRPNRIITRTGHFAGTTDDEMAKSE
ncbi:hypothetical protein FJY63_07880, partial [Candidatus Sumerlaeota bacterium]|nr:hypothetical protein [Candidatus Sumerlaeota bacterium]